MALLHVDRQVQVEPTFHGRAIDHADAAARGQIINGCREDGGSRRPSLQAERARKRSWTTRLGVVPARAVAQRLIRPRSSGHRLGARGASLPTEGPTR